MTGPGDSGTQSPKEGTRAKNDSRVLIGSIRVKTMPFTKTGKTGKIIGLKGNMARLIDSLRCFGGI